MDFEHPDEGLYGRVSNPDRYQVVVDATRILIDRLVATYEVDSMAGARAGEFPEFPGSTADVLRLSPNEGATLAFMFTGFPGVVIHAGEWFVEAYPSCGCDACDELPTSVIARLEELVTAVVRGRFSEELTKRTLSHAFDGEWGSTSSKRRLEREDRRRHGSPGLRQWSAWTER